MVHAILQTAQLECAVEFVGDEAEIQLFVLPDDMALRLENLKVHYVLKQINSIEDMWNCSIAAISEQYKSAKFYCLRV